MANRVERVAGTVDGDEKLEHCVTLITLIDRRQGESGRCLHIAGVWPFEQRDGLSLLYERRRKDGVKTAPHVHKKPVKVACNACAVSAASDDVGSGTSSGRRSLQDGSPEFESPFSWCSIARP
ncbi:hypothetical protein [Ralstonia sp. 11b]|uniref:hypothetical protein n=1 Tax=Ralstonia sp. 11b TaxID=3063544 RepID=UPI00262DD46F|nr:hypothetical protein [Ralstonia sp. 11b]MDR9385966.1 hypothetical protein [Ralstonia sp. 11b]